MSEEKLFPVSMLLHYSICFIASLRSANRHRMVENAICQSMRFGILVGMVLFVTHMHSHARTHACTHARTHARTHAHTHSESDRNELFGFSEVEAEERQAVRTDLSCQ